MQLHDDPLQDPGHIPVGTDPNFCCSVGTAALQYENGTGSQQKISDRSAVAGAGSNNYNGNTEDTSHVPTGVKGVDVKAGEVIHRNYYTGVEDRPQEQVLGKSAESGRQKSKATHRN